jgi:hypothetical protein
LPDGLFQYPKSQFGFVLEVIGMENVAIFYDHLEYLQSFGTSFGYWIILRSFRTFSRHFGKLLPEKSGNPGMDIGKRRISNFFSKKLKQAGGCFAIIKWKKLPN